MGSIYTRRRDERQADKLVWICSFIVLCSDQEGPRRRDCCQGVGIIIWTRFCGLVGVFLGWLSFQHCCYFSSYFRIHAIQATPFAIQHSPSSYFCYTLFYI